MLLNLQARTGEDVAARASYEAPPTHEAVNDVVGRSDRLFRAGAHDDGALACVETTPDVPGAVRFRGGEHSRFAHR